MWLDGRCSACWHLERAFPGSGPLVSEELARDAEELLATHGYHETTVYDVDAEGVDDEIVFVLNGKPRMAALRTDGKKRRIAVTHNWPVL